MAVTNWRMLIVQQSPLVANPAVLCRFPGLFLMTDFTGPGVAMKRGRRQEPRTIAELSASGLLARWIRRVPAAVLLRFAIRKRKTAKSLLGPSGYHPAFLEFRPDRLSSSVPLITFCEFALTPIFSAQGPGLRDINFSRHRKSRRNCKATLPWRPATNTI